MYIVIDILEKVNSEVLLGHIDRQILDDAINDYTALKMQTNQQDALDDIYKLHITDDLPYARELLTRGRHVVPVLSSTNSSEDFSGFSQIVTSPDEIDMEYYYKIWQRLMNLPWHITDTPRCIIREMSPRDLDSLYRIYSDSTITKYTEPLFPDYEDELEYTHNYIKNVYEYFGFGTWIVINKENGEIIGRAGFNLRPDFDYPEIGFVIAAPYQNMGYATEVCKAIIEYGTSVHEFERIQAMVIPENESSIHLLKKLSFIYRDDYEQFSRYILDC